ncbi:TPA: hypothetical protein HA361_06725 [Candidatus Woesearchaeota archaeon]|nr:hypothetical protein [Candidatus Woesearchaeota archaeon]HII69554.1 hypothetical protein [Candidatus Woesearchaeota archaeon]
MDSKIPLCLALLLFFPSFVMGIEVAIEVNKEFSLHEEIMFTFSIISEEGMEVVYVPYIECPSLPVAFLHVHNTLLRAGSEFTSEYKALKISQDVDSQSCNAVVSIINPVNYTYRKNFNIIADKSFELSPILCKDEACMFRKRTYSESDLIYLDYVADIEDIALASSLIYPDNTRKDISVPSTLKPNVPGTYALQLTASKDGYKTISKTATFMVIGKQGNQSSGSPERYAQKWLLVLLEIAATILATLLCLYLLKIHAKKTG